MTSVRHGSNKDTVPAFYERAINNKDLEAAAELIGPRYIQHNPRTADGIQGLKDFIATSSTHTRACAQKSRRSSPRTTWSSPTSTGYASPASAAQPSWTSSSSRTESPSNTGTSCSRSPKKPKCQRHAVSVRWRDKSCALAPHVVDGSLVGRPSPRRADPSLAAWSGWPSSYRGGSEIISSCPAYTTTSSWASASQPTTSWTPPCARRSLPSTPTFSLGYIASCQDREQPDQGPRAPARWSLPSTAVVLDTRGQAQVGGPAVGAARALDGSQQARLGAGGQPLA
jgi:hypothetical protein